MLVKMEPELRVHISTLGFLPDQIYIPAIQMRADRVYILRYPHEQHPKALNALKKIKEVFDEKNIEPEEIECDIFSIPVIVKTLRTIIQKEKNNNIHLNISSGSAISSSSFIMAAMLYKKEAHKLTPHYALYDYDKMKADQTKISKVPVFRISIPDEKQCKVLKILKEHPEGLRKSEILAKIHTTYAATKDKDIRSSWLMALNRQVIQKLEQDWEMIKVNGKRKGAIVKLTENGNDFVEFL